MSALSLTPQTEMRALVRRLRGIVRTAITWGIGWAAIMFVVTTILGLLDPQSIDEGETPLYFARVVGTVGLASGAFFATVFTLAEGGGRRRSIAELSMWRCVAWGLVGSAILPLATPMNDVLLLNTLPLGALSAAGTLAIARRAARRELPATEGAAALPPE